VLARLFGRRWASWFQPQHLHFIPLANLRAELESRGFEIREVLRGKAHLSSDVSFWLYTIIESLAPPRGLSLGCKPQAIQRRGIRWFRGFQAPSRMAQSM